MKKMEEKKFVYEVAEDYFLPVRKRSEKDKLADDLRAMRGLVDHQADLEYVRQNLMRALKIPDELRGDLEGPRQEQPGEGHLLGIGNPELQGAEEDDPVPDGTDS